MNTSNKLGVIVGRFQVPELLPHHIEFIDKVVNETGNVLIILVTPVVEYNAFSPFPFDVVRDMLLYYFNEERKKTPDRYGKIEITFTMEQKYGEKFFANVDRIIHTKATEMNLWNNPILINGKYQHITIFFGGHQERQMWNMYQGDFNVSWVGTFVEKQRALHTRQMTSASNFAHSVSYRYGINKAVQDKKGFVRLGIIAVVSCEDEYLVYQEARMEKLSFPHFILQNSINSSLEKALKVSLESSFFGTTFQLPRYEFSFAPDDNWEFRKIQSNCAINLVFSVKSNKTITGVTAPYNNYAWKTVEKLGLDTVEDEFEQIVSYLGLINKPKLCQPL